MPSGVPSADALRVSTTTGRGVSLVQGLVLAMLLLAIGSLYSGVIAGLGTDWLRDENYAHGLLVVPAVSWLIWTRRKTLAALPQEPSWAGANLVLLSLCVLLTGEAAAELFLVRLSLVGVLAGTVVQLFGWRQLVALRLAFLLLLLAVPLPALILNQIAFPLQLLASRIGVAMLSWVGIPVAREGNIILLQQATLEVAEACSGVRSLISIVTLALVYGSLTKQRIGVRAAVLVAAVPVVVLANGMRVAGAGIASHVYGPGSASGFLHTFSGWVFFGVSVAMLLVIERCAVFVGRLAVVRSRRGHP